LNLKKLAEERKKQLEEGKKDGSSGPAAAGRALSRRSISITKDLEILDIPPAARMRFPKKGDIKEIEFLISPTDGLWKGGNFVFKVTFPSEYRMKPPTVKCLTKVYHPNINFNGDVCLSILRDTEWTAVMDTSHILMGLFVLFYEPDASDPLNVHLGELMKKDYNKFAQNVASSFRGLNVEGQSFEKQPIKYDFPENKKTGK
ncbi:MAG: putative ubiquitin-conjugating enzyme E2M, partial [Streblomastix strix]